jgi:hypothetical protein
LFDGRPRSGLDSADVFDFLPAGAMTLHGGRRTSVLLMKTRVPILIQNYRPRFLNKYSETCDIEHLCTCKSEGMRTNYGFQVISAEKCFLNLISRIGLPLTFLCIDSDGI